ncbi:MAG: hypothetical protein ABI855_02835 [Bacteroidota bacterium]
MYIRNKIRKPFIDKDIILEQIKQGVPFYEIAAQYGISISELSDLAEAKTENEKLKNTIQVKNAIIALYKKGKNHVEIASLTKLDLSLINKTLSDYFQRKANPVPVPVAKNNFYKKDPADLEERKKRNRDAIAAFRSGMPPKEIAKKYKIKQHWLNKILRTHGLSSRKRNSKKNPEDFIPRIIDDFQNKLTVKQIAEKYKIQIIIIYNILKANGACFTKRGSKKTNPHLIPDMIADFKSGLPVKSVAEKYGLSKCHFYTILKSNGVSCRKWSIKEIQLLTPVIIADFQNELPVKKIAEKHEISFGTIYKILKANGISFSATHPKRKSVETMENAIADFKAGLTVKQAAEKNNISKALVYKLLKLNKIAFRKEDRSLPRKRGYKKNNKKGALNFLKIKELFESRISIEEIATVINRNPATIRQILRSNGIIESISVRCNKTADEMETLFKQGLTRKQIAEMYNKSTGYVSKTLRKRGFSFSNGWSEKIINAFQSGKTIDQAASSLKLTRSHIKNTLRKAGIPYLTRANETNQNIARLYKENIKIPEIARLLNMSPVSVIANLNKQKLLPAKGTHPLKRRLLLEEYQNGNTDIQKLSASYGIRLTEAQHVCTRGNEIKERTRLILQLHHEGKTVTEIKQITGFPKRKIWRAFSKNGIHSNDHEIRFNQDFKKILPLLKEGKTGTEIISLLHVGQRTVWRARKIYFDKEKEQ